MRAVAEADRGRGPRHLLLRHDMLEIAEPEPAILFRHGDPVQPSAPISGHSSVGNQSSSSIFAAIGSIRSLAKRRVVSRIVSAISPRSKSRPSSDMGRLLRAAA